MITLVVFIVLKIEIIRDKTLSAIENMDNRIWTCWYEILIIAISQQTPSTSLEISCRETRTD